MAIRRISELDEIISADYIIDGSLTDKAKKGLFEISEWDGESDGVPSYYISKKLNLETLAAITTGNMQLDIDDLSDIIKQIQNNIRTLSVDLSEIKRQIGDISSTMNKWHNELFDPTNISCRNLSVQNDIHGCALSARWC